MKKIYLMLLMLLSILKMNAQNTCASAVPIASVPYSSGTLTTCGTGNDYAAGSYFTGNYGAGEDYVFSINITSAPVAYNFALGGSATWKIASVHSACDPTTANAVGGITTSSGTTASGLVVFPTTGTYYIFVDTWPTPNCGEFTLDITVPTDPMTYVSSNTTQSSTSAVIGGTLNQQIIRLQVVTIGGASPLSLTSIDFNTNGSTNPADIAAAKVYYTGTSTTFSTANQFGTTVNNPSGSFTVTGSQFLGGGTANTNSYFWLVYDVACSATGANVLDAECTSATIGGVAQTPTTTAPTGTRAITAASTTITTNQPSTGLVATGSTDNQVLRVQATSCAGSTVTDINFNTTGSTSPATDISTARVYFTTTTTFSSATLFGSAVASPSGAFTVSGSQVLASGTGYFWLVYDVPVSATAGNVLDAACESVVINAATVAPATLNPTGTRTIVVAPANDNCSTATPLTVNADITCVVSTNGTTVNATQSPEVPTPTCSATGINDDVWFSFVATNTTQILNITGATNTTAINVYSGTCGALVNLGCLTTTGGIINGVLNSSVVGTTYYIRAYSTSAVITTSTDFTICIASPPPPPSNDDCANALTVTANPDASCTSVTAGTVAGATGSADPTCIGSEDDDVWFTFVATSTSHLISLLDIVGTSTDMVFQVFDACGGTSLLCSDPNSSVVSGLTIGNSYLIRVYTSTTTGAQTTTFDVCVSTPPPPPANDDCSGAIAIPCDGSVSGNNISASTTPDALAAVTCGSTTATLGNNFGVWHTVTPANSGSLTISTCTGTQWDTYLRVYTGTCGAFTACAGSDDDGCSETSFGLSQVTFTATAGTTYYILLGGYDNADFGAYTISATCPAPCATPTAVAVAAGSLSSTGANISWTGTGTFVLEYGPTGFTPGTGATAGGGTVINPAVSPQAISGLTPSTGYDVYVRQDCTGSGAGFSSNSTVLTFTTLAPPPSNDECAGATPIGLTAVSSTNNNATQTMAPLTCETFTSSSAPDVWFQFTPPSSGDATVLLSNAVSLDAIVEVFSGSCGSLTSLGCSDGTTSGGDEDVNLTGLTGGQTYYVRVYGWNGDTGTFDISVSGAAMPVAIEYFRGTKQNNRNVLDWKVTCTGSPSVTLVLERSADGRSYAPIYTSSETAARCLQPFTQNDLQPLPGLNYYRLKTIDIDGKIGYSSVVVLMGKNKGFELVSLAPNPVKANATLTVTTAEKSIMEIVIRDINGKQVSKQRISLIAGNNQIPLSMEKAAAGIYTVTGLTADGEMRTIKFVKE